MGSARILTSVFRESTKDSAGETSPEIALRCHAADRVIPRYRGASSACRIFLAADPTPREPRRSQRRVHRANGVAAAEDRPSARTRCRAGQREGRNLRQAPLRNLRHVQTASLVVSANRRPRAALGASSLRVRRGRPAPRRAGDGRHRREQGGNRKIFSLSSYYCLRRRARGSARAAGSPRAVRLQLMKEP